MDESIKRIAPFGLRLPPDLKERVQEAANQSNLSMNALIQALLEREYPQPTINLHELAAFLEGLSLEWHENGGDQCAYLREVNKGLSTSVTPWSVKCDDGVVSFYPHADPRFGKNSFADDRGPNFPPPPRPHRPPLDLKGSDE